MIDSRQIKAARALLAIDQRGLAALAGVTERTVIRAEKGTRISDQTQAALKLALEKKGAIFIDENGDGPGVRLRKRGRK